MEGDAISLVCVDELGLLREIEAVLRHPVRQEIVPGFEVDRSIRPQAILQRSGGGGRPVAPRRPNSRPQSSGGGFAPARRPGGHRGSGIGNRSPQPNRSGGHRSGGRNEFVAMPGESLKRQGHRPA